MKKREAVHPLTRVPIGAAINGRIEGLEARGEPTLKVGDLVKFIVTDDWEHCAIEAPIFTDEPALGVVRSTNWMLLVTREGDYYIPEAEVFWSITEKTTKHLHDSLEVVNAVQSE